jgi:hypothetical protein
MPLEAAPWLGGGFGPILAINSAEKENIMSEQRKAGRGRIYSSITETIGDTPIVRLDKLASENGVKANLLAKLVFFYLLGWV